MSFPWLTVIGAVPLVGAALVLALPASLKDRAREIALTFSLASLVLVIIMALQFKRNSSTQFQFAEVHQWIPQFGVSYALGVDGIGLVLIALAAVLTPVCILAAWNDVPEVGGRQQNYFALMLVLQTMMVGVFAATDVFLFYVFFEAMLIPVYFLIGSFGGAQRQYAAVKFLLYSLAGGLLMLVAVIALYYYGPGGHEGFLLTHLVGHLHAGTTATRWMFLGFFIAFAIKAPMVPVHTWLPDAASEATPATSVLLVGVLDKVGTFGMIRLCLPLFPDAAKWFTPTVIVFAVISIIYGALLAIGQTDIMRLIAYTSVSHFGFIVLGIFAMTSSAQNGATLYMVNHGFSTAAMFLIAAMLVKRRGSRRIADFGGWQRLTPLLAGTFLIAGLSSLALPGLSSFVSEFLVLVGTFARYKVAASFAVTGIVLAALYILLMYQRMMTGPKPEGAFVDQTPDMQRREAWVVAPIIAILVVLGLFPKPVLDVISPAVSRTMQQVGVTDPAPTNPIPAAEGSSK
jgi:NADH-quinone oxidoreductase subunit M